MGAARPWTRSTRPAEQPGLARGPVRRRSGARARAGRSNRDRGDREPDRIPAPAASTTTSATRSRQPHLVRGPGRAADFPFLDSGHLFHGFAHPDRLANRVVGGFACTVLRCSFADAAYDGLDSPRTIQGPGRLRGGDSPRAQNGPGGRRDLDRVHPWIAPSPTPFALSSSTFPRKRPPDGPIDPHLAARAGPGRQRARLPGGQGLAHPEITPRRSTDKNRYPPVYPRRCLWRRAHEHRRPCRTGPPTGDRAVSVLISRSLRHFPRPGPICYGRGEQDGADSKRPRREGAHTMSESEARIDRRDFLRGSMAAATAGATGIPGSAHGGSARRGHRFHSRRGRCLPRAVRRGLAAAPDCRRGGQLGRGRPTSVRPTPPPRSPGTSSSTVMSARRGHRHGPAAARPQGRSTT